MPCNCVGQLTLDSFNSPTIDTSNSPINIAQSYFGNTPFQAVGGQTSGQQNDFNWQGFSDAVGNLISVGIDAYGRILTIKNMTPTQAANMNQQNLSAYAGGGTFGLTANPYLLLGVGVVLILMFGKK